MVPAVAVGMNVIFGLELLNIALQELFIEITVLATNNDTGNAKCNERKNLLTAKPVPNTGAGFIFLKMCK